MTDERTEPDDVGEAYRVLFTKVLGHRDGSEGPCPRCDPEAAASYDRAAQYLAEQRNSATEI
jgi:hypothetical protein